MDKKQYRFYRLLIIILLCSFISVSITLKSYLLPIAFMIVAMGMMFYLRKQLKSEEVSADERDYQVAGTAARYAISIYAWVGVIAVFVLMYLSEQKEELYFVSQYVAFSVCFLMLLNVVLFKYLERKGR